MTIPTNYGTFFWRVTAAHVISYFTMGIIAASLLNYQSLFANENLSCFMRPTDSTWVAAGPLLQIIRGFIFSVALWFFRDIFINQPRGWFKLWIVIALLCVFTPTGPAPGSVEGFIYTKVPPLDQVKGYLEVLPQTMLFSWIIFSWYKKPTRWWNILSSTLFIIICLMSIMGIIVHFFPIDA